MPPRTVPAIDVETPPITPAESQDPADPENGRGSQVVTFARNFDFTWPSRAMTAYKKGWSGRVKVVVARAAEAAGALVADTNGKDS